MSRKFLKEFAFLRCGKEAYGIWLGSRYFAMAAAVNTKAPKSLTVNLVYVCVEWGWTGEGVRACVLVYYVLDR